MPLTDVNGVKNPIM